MPVSNDVYEVVYDKIDGYTTEQQYSGIGAKPLLVSGSYDIDLSREYGNLAKRRGLEAQLTTYLGSTGILSGHNYISNSGDIPLIAHGWGLYSFTGTLKTISKTTNADFNAGSLNSTEAYNNGIILGPTQSYGYSTTVGEFHDDVTTTYLSSRKTGWQTFTATTAIRHLKAIRITAGPYSSTGWAIAKAEIYDETGTTRYAIKEYSTSQETVEFDTPVELTPGTVYRLVFSKLATDDSARLYMTNDDGYAGGRCDYSSTRDYGFKLFAAKYATGGTWTSQTYDLGSTPVTATLAWSATFPTGTSLMGYARGSHDGMIWGEWQTVSASGNAIPKNRYLQTRFSEATSNQDNTPVVNDFTVYYTTAYDKAVPIVWYSELFSSSTGWYLTNTGGSSFISSGELKLVGNGSANAMASRLVMGIGGNEYTVAIRLRRGTTGVTPSAALHVDFYVASPLYDDAGFTVEPAEVGNSYVTLTKTIAANWTRPDLAYLRIFTAATGGYYIDSIILTKAGPTANERVRFTDYNDRCYFTSGYTTWSYDGTQSYPAYWYSPTEAPTLGTHDTGSGITGNYYGKYSYVLDDGTETGLSPASNLIAPSADSHVEWTNIPLGYQGVTKRKLYRTRAGGSIYYYVTTIEDNVTRTYADYTLDVNLLTEYSAYAYGYPPYSYIVTRYRDYLLYASRDYPNRLYFSRPGFVQQVKSTAYKEYPGDITGVAVYQDAVIVCGLTYTHAVIGTVWDADPAVNNTQTVVLSDSFGAFTHESMVVCSSSDGDILVFPTRQGLNYITPGLQDDSMRSIPLSYAVQTFFNNITNTTKLTAVFDKNRYILACTEFGTETAVTYNNKVIVFDFRTSLWSPPWRMNLSCFFSANGQLYAGASNLGQVYAFESGTTDAGANIHAIAKLGLEYTTLGINKRKRFSWYRAAATSGSDLTTLTFTFDVDDATYTDTIGTTSFVSRRRSIRLGNGYKLQLTLDDNSDNDWVLTQIVIEYTGGDLYGI